MKIIAFIFFSFLSFTNSFCQEKETCLYIAKYTYKVVNDRGKELSDRLILSIGNNASLLQSLVRYDIDSINRRRITEAIQDNPNHMKSTHIPLKGLPIKIYNRYSDSNFLIYRTFDNDYYWDLKKISFNWRIDKDSIYILGFNCKKATAFHPQLKQNITVWFTDEIPFITGPGLLQGLPGLILKMKSDDNKLLYEIYSFSKPQNKSSWTTINIPTSAIKTTQKEFDERLEYMKKNPYQGINPIQNINNKDNFFKN